MKEYKFEKIELSGLKGMKSKPKENYHEIIRNHSEEGWELVQIFAPGTSAYGSSSYLEIIFTREKEWYISLIFEHRIPSYQIRQLLFYWNVAISNMFIWIVPRIVDT